MKDLSDEAVLTWTIVTAGQDGQGGCERSFACHAYESYWERPNTDGEYALQCPMNGPNLDWNR